LKGEMLAGRAKCVTPSRLVTQLVCQIGSNIDAELHIEIGVV